MSRTRSTYRPRGIPILGLFGVLLLAAGVVAVAQVTNCVNCNCYFSTDCKCPNMACSYATGCKHWTNNGKAVDGQCVPITQAAAISLAETGLAARALELWLLSYEQAAWRGGEPDAELVAKAVAIPLAPAQHEALRRAALDTEARLFGLAGDSPEQHGSFVMPAVTLCPVVAPQAAAAAPANGSLRKEAPASLGAAQIVREAMVAELLAPYRSNFEQVMDRIPKEFPAFAAQGTCELPASSADHFPYQSSLDCLKHETLAIVHLLLAAGGGEREARRSYVP